MATITAPTPKSGSRAALAAEIWAAAPGRLLGARLHRAALDRPRDRLALLPDLGKRLQHDAGRSRSTRSWPMASFSLSSPPASICRSGRSSDSTGVAFAMLLANGVSVVIAARLTLALGLAIGIGNGLAVDKLGIPAFIVTLAGLQGYRGLTMLVSGGMTVAGLPDLLGNFLLTRRSSGYRRCLS